MGAVGCRMGTVGCRVGAVASGRMQDRRCRIGVQAGAEKAGPPACHAVLLMASRGGSCPSDEVQY